MARLSFDQVPGSASIYRVRDSLGQVGVVGQVAKCGSVWVARTAWESWDGPRQAFTRRADAAEALYETVTRQVDRIHA